jgi:hypothetical protein
MARVLRSNDRIRLVIDEANPEEHKECLGRGCAGCRHSGFVSGEVTGQIVFVVKPLSYQEKVELQSFTKVQSGVETRSQLEEAKTCLAMAVKEVQGLYTDKENKVPYQLTFEPNGRLTDECVSELLNIPVSPQLIMGCLALRAGVQTKLASIPGYSSLRFEFIDPSPNVVSLVK